MAGAEQLHLASFWAALQTRKNPDRRSLVTAHDFSCAVDVLICLAGFCPFQNPNSSEDFQKTRVQQGLKAIFQRSTFSARLKAVP
jgi:hypothetical protein